MQTALRTIEVFRPGTFIAMGGQSCSFSSDDLKAMAAAYDAEGAPAPGVVGHPKIDAPAYSWAKAFRWDEANQRLLADMGEIEPQFAEAVAAGRFKKISLALFPPDAANNPKPGAWYPKHIGFLGAAAPAVSGLKPISFTAGDDAVEFEFADARALREVAGLFQQLREFLIDQFGGESAAKALPRWTIDWIDGAADRDPDPQPMFAAPSPAPAQKKDVSMTDKTKPDQAALDARAAALDKRERALAHADNLAFAEGLVGEGRLVPALKDKVVGLLDHFEPADATVEFAEGDATKTATPAELLRDILKSQPKVVNFGAADLGESVGGQSIDFAAPDGAKIDPGSLDLHRRALAWQASHAGVSYTDAVTAVNR